MDVVRIADLDSKVNENHLQCVTLPNNCFLNRCKGDKGERGFDGAPGLMGKFNAR